MKKIYNLLLVPIFLFYPTIALACVGNSANFDMLFVIVGIMSVLIVGGIIFYVKNFKNLTIIKKWFYILGIVLSLFIAIILIEIATGRIMFACVDSF